MQSSSSLTPPLPPPPSTHHRPLLRISRFPPSHWSTSTTICAALKRNPKGFGPQNLKNPPPKPNTSQKLVEEEEEEYQDSVIPEVVTNRMINRIGLSVGVPLFIGLLFFPFFYYLKVILKLDIPSFIPVMVSFVFFGAALAGVSYGIVSTSWDPLREGSFLGWTEAQRNWPVFWSSIWKGGGSDKSSRFK